MTVSSIDSKIDEAIAEIKKAYAEIEKQSFNFEPFPSEITLSTDLPDYVTACYEIAEMIRQLQILKAAHNFYKIDDPLKQKLFEQYQNGEAGKSIIITEKYTVSNLDTWNSIEIKTGVSWRTIAEYNNLESVSLLGGQVLEIPYEYDPEAVRQFFSENPVFDLHEGERVLGKDLPNELEVGTDMDLKVLGNRETFIQGLENILDTEEGSLPFFPHFGFDSLVGDDIPSEVTDEWLKMKLRTALMRDKRVQDVPLDRMSTDREEEGLSIEIDVLPINNLDFETLSTEI
jgi:LysM repeat protein